MGALRFDVRGFDWRQSPLKVLIISAGSESE